MSHRRTSRVGALARQLLRVQLRLKVMAGVVIVTLVALVAFDVGAVATVRRYLLAQTDNNLQMALSLTLPKLAAFLAVESEVTGPRGPNVLPAQFPHMSSIKNVVPALPGAYDMAFLPPRGRQVTLQIAANGGLAGADWTLSPTAAQVAIKPGPHTLVGPNGRTVLLLRSLHAMGGSLVAGTSLDQVDETIVQIELIVILGSIAVVLLIGLGVFVVLRRGLRPIEAMAAQADRITAGDLTDRVTPHHPGSEVGRLGTALNGMLARIEADVYEREASQQQMRRFFADASHELRTPLASLRANAELYQQGALRSRDEVDEVMDRIVLETRRMGRLVEDMLRLARLGQHPGQSAEPVDLTAVVTGCADRVRIADPARTWQVRIADGLTTVGDEELLRRAVDNLLMNVLVHTPGDTAGSIIACEASGQVSIEVSDDGPGVPPDKLPHIFERFYRAASAGSTGTAGGTGSTGGTGGAGARSGCPGSGLGLAIAAEIASAHGGAAQAAPAVPHGLRIKLTFPVRGQGKPGPRSVRELAASVSWAGSLPVFLLPIAGRRGTRGVALAGRPLDHRGHRGGQGDVARADELPGPGDAEDEEKDGQAALAADPADVMRSPVQLHRVAQLQAVQDEQDGEHPDVAPAHPLLVLPVQHDDQADGGGQPGAGQNDGRVPQAGQRQQADQRDDQGVDQRRERCGRPDLVFGAGVFAGQPLLGHREGDEEQPDERARDAGAAAEEVMEASRDHRPTVPAVISRRRPPGPWHPRWPGPRPCCLGGRDPGLDGLAGLATETQSKLFLRPSRT